MIYLIYWIYFVKDQECAFPNASSAPHTQFLLAVTANIAAEINKGVVGIV